MEAFIAVVGMLLGYLLVEWFEYRKMCKKIALIEQELSQSKN